MREIKFRAWDDGKMFNVAVIDFNHEEINLNAADIVNFESVKLMQYIGLKDKNGVEIYEGDIVHIIYDCKEFIYQIAWDNEELDFKATNGKEDYGSNFQYLGCVDEIEVIGNIYENKELLGGKQ